MNFRRSDFDVTNRVNTTEPGSVMAEVIRIYRSLYPRGRLRPLRRVFRDITALYRGEHPDYDKCDTEYHDIQHVLDVSLAMARLLDGYERARGDGPALGDRLFVFGIVCALFHDAGYLRRRGDRKHRRGAEYTRIHVTRGGRLLREYLPTIGLDEFVAAAPAVLHFTGYERPVKTIRLSDPLLRLLGSLLGSADILAQMSDRCYLEKCRDRLYPEFVAGGIDRRKTAKGEEVLFSSADDLLRKTPGFFRSASQRLDYDLGGAWKFAAPHFGGQNLYMDALRRNINFAETVQEAPSKFLKRVAPITIN
jgi:hypothetical protein